MTFFMLQNIYEKCMSIEVTGLLKSGRNHQLIGYTMKVQLAGKHSIFKNLDLVAIHSSDPQV